MQTHCTMNLWNSPGGHFFVIDTNIPKTAKKWVFNWKPRCVQICYKKQGRKIKSIGWEWFERTLIMRINNQKRGNDIGLHAMNGTFALERKKKASRYRKNKKQSRYLEFCQSRVAGAHVYEKRVEVQWHSYSVHAPLAAPCSPSERLQRSR